MPKARCQKHDAKSTKLLPESRMQNNNRQSAREDPQDEGRWRKRGEYRLLTCSEESRADVTSHISAGGLPSPEQPHRVAGTPLEAMLSPVFTHFPFACSKAHHDRRSIHEKHSTHLPCSYGFGACGAGAKNEIQKRVPEPSHNDEAQIRNA
jgi:hypothetical protein